MIKSFYPYAGTRNHVLSYTPDEATAKAFTHMCQLVGLTATYRDKEQKESEYRYEIKIDRKSGKES